jgi:predicted RNA binding protein YcfA (HicA-like mRNA interferase family)
VASLPVLRPREVVAALRRAGFVLDRQSGSHAILKDEHGRRVTVPMHGRDLKTGTLRAIVREAGMSVDEFVAWL